MTDFLPRMIWSESAVWDKWPLIQMSEINHHREMFAQPRDQTNGPKVTNLVENDSVQTNIV